MFENPRRNQVSNWLYKIFSGGLMNGKTKHRASYFWGAAPNLAIEIAVFLKLKSAQQQ